MIEQHIWRIFPVYFVLFGIVLPNVVPDWAMWPVFVWGVVTYFLYLRMRVGFDELNGFGVRPFWNEFWIGPFLLVFVIPIEIWVWWQGRFDE